MHSEYVVHRHRPRKETADPYDGFANKYPPSLNTIPRDYWSNGKTSILTMNSRTSNTDTAHTSHTFFSTTLNAPIEKSNKMTIIYPSQSNEIFRNSVRGASDKSTVPTTMKVTADVSSNLMKKSIFAGSIAGMTSCVIFHPFDVVRMKMQSETSISNTTSSASRKSTMVRSNAGPLSIFTQIIRNGGFRALYTGLGLSLCTQAFYKATIFTSNQIIQKGLIEWHTNERRKLGNYTNKYRLTLFDHFLCGACSGAINAFIFVAPIEFVRNQHKVQHTKLASGEVTNYTQKKMKGHLDVILRTIKTTGSISSLWNGAGITLMRDSLGYGSFFLFFQIGQKYVLPNLTGNRDKHSLTNKVGSGFMAGFGYWFASLPLDAMRTLVQTGQATSTKEVISTLIQRDGIVGIKELFKGWQVAFGRGSPSAAVTITMYSLVFNTLMN